jgi:hypothetical protein
MRFNTPRNGYPLPILRPDGHDSNYMKSDLIFHMDIESDTSPNKIVLKHEIKQPDIRKLINSKKATVSLAIHCDDTYFYDLIDLSNKKKQTINFTESNVFGNVYFTLIVKAVRDFSGFKPKKLEYGFNGLTFDVKKGDILAISDEFHQVYQLPPVYLGESIFELVEQPELDELEFEVDPTEQKIKIGVGVELNKLVQRNMDSANGRINNICTIYHPVLIEVLYRVKSEQFEGRAWYESAKAALSGIGIDIEGDQMEPLQAAQKLLRHPYQSLLSRE